MFGVFYMMHLLYKSASTKWLIHCSSIPFHVSHLEEGFSSNVLGPDSMAKIQQTNEPHCFGAFKTWFQKKNIRKVQCLNDVASHFGANIWKGWNGKKKIHNWSDGSDRLWGRSFLYMLHVESFVSQNWILVMCFFELGRGISVGNCESLSLLTLDQKTCCIHTLA